MRDCASSIRRLKTCDTADKNVCATIAPDRCMKKRILMVLACVSCLSCAARGQGFDGQQLTNEIRNTRALLKGQHPELSGAEIDSVAYSTSLSNYLARSIEIAVRNNDLTNAESLF